MTRDFELIRNLLIQVEQHPSGPPMMQISCDDSIPEAVLGEHLQLLIEAELIEGEVFQLEPLGFVIQRLTWQGHDFLQHARNDTIWRKVLSEAKEKGLSLTLKVLAQLLAKAAEKLAGL